MNPLFTHCLYKAIQHNKKAGGCSRRTCAWLPAELQMTPRCSCSGVRRLILLYAPRTLNDRTGWRTEGTRVRGGEGGMMGSEGGSGEGSEGEGRAVQGGQSGGRRITTSGTFSTAVTASIKP